MRYLRLKILLLSLLGSVLSGSAAICFTTGQIALGILMTLGVAIVLLLLYHCIRRLIRTMSIFVSALEMNEVAVRFDIGTDDPELRKMSESMNRIVEIYGRSRLELETRKLYYDRILKVMTHEMRNSITPLISLADDMRRNADRYVTQPSEPYFEALGLIADQSEGIKHFLDAYYSLTHIPKPQLQRVEAHDFFRRITDLFAHEAMSRGENEKKLSIVIGQEVKLNIDRSLVTQALMNILRNSLDALAGRKDGRIVLTATMSGRIPTITIEDNGPGIPDEVKKNIFQPFMTTKPGGSGIGLCLSRQIARLHGGDLTVSSIENVSTLVRMTLKNGV